MGIQDTSTKDYLRDADIFADAVNYYLYDGEPVVKPDSLKPLDSNLLLHVFGQEEQKRRKPKRGNEQTVERYRDVVRQWNVMADEICAYAIFGIEAQTTTHYAMPVKSIVYDAMQYAHQVEELKVKHRNAGDKGSSAEFLSDMHRDDHLIPVITICIHFGTEPWDGALSLKELFDLKDEHLLQYVQDYKVLLIEPDRICDEDFAKFSTSLGAVLQFMKAAQDKRKLKELVNGNEVFRRLDRKAARVIRDCANVRIDIETSEEVVNVCKGWEDAIEDAREEVRLEERTAAQEREKQLCKGWEDAIEDAREEVRLEERTAA
ncbi:MAG: Rpn family recombination-promoting nuclease/putative transposase, partial [Lachnospiraceae bacterium]|nr:Rpn family recombination-promoting nuclease/putative transposase [Lachnospiraceae bacterium]